MNREFYGLKVIFRVFEPVQSKYGVFFCNPEQKLSIISLFRIIDVCRTLTPEMNFLSFHSSIQNRFKHKNLYLSIVICYSIILNLLYYWMKKFYDQCFNLNTMNKFVMQCYWKSNFNFRPSKINKTEEQDLTSNLLWINCLILVIFNLISSLITEFPLVRTQISEYFSFKSIICFK